MNSSRTFHAKLTAIVEQEDGSPLQRDVCSSVLDHCDTDEQIVDFFRGLARRGCVCGMVSGLVYYAETHAFFDRHYHEIETLRHTMEEHNQHMIDDLKSTDDLKNVMAWFGFETMAQHIAEDILGIDLFDDQERIEAESCQIPTN